MPPACIHQLQSDIKTWFFQDFVPIVPRSFAILSIIILTVRLIRGWEWERERVHRDRSGRRSRACAGATRPGSCPSRARGRLALPESPDTSPVCCALPDSDSPGLVAVGIGACEKGWVCCAVVSGGVIRCKRLQTYWMCIERWYKSLEPIPCSPPQQGPAEPRCSRGTRFQQAECNPRPRS